MPKECNLQNTRRQIHQKGLGQYGVSKVVFLGSAYCPWTYIIEVHNSSPAFPRTHRIRNYQRNEHTCNTQQTYNQTPYHN